MSADGSNRSGDAGIALLLVIWVSALLAGLAAQITVDTRSAVDIAHARIESSRARALAESGVWATVVRLLNEETAHTVRLDGTGQTFAELGDGVTVAVVDERAKLDLNVIGEVPLRQLLLAVGVGPQQAARAAAAIVRHRNAGAVGAGAPARSPAFASVAELQQVPGISPPLRQRLAPFLTVHTGDWGINPVAAPPEVLAALPAVDAAEALSYVELRRRHRGDPVALRLATPLEIVRQAVWTPPRVVTITAATRLPSGTAFARQAVVDLAPDDGRLVRVLAWSQAVGD